ncbi:MAG: hypothetical protein MK312_12530, partial [Roseibacillus sp.]|nr:hypothetical protein [Roseibacillus sp.]
MITGASRGIGRGIGLSLASIGHDLVINYAGHEKAALQTAEPCQQVAKHAGASLASTFQHDLDWAPEKNAAEKMRKHQLYRKTHINYA